MTKQVPFINREQEFASIDKLIGEWNTQYMLCIDAPGGVGKTRLLQEIYQRYTKPEGESSHFVMTEILDFEDRTLHLPQNLASTIARLLNKKKFRSYFQALQKLRKMEVGDASRERLEQELSSHVNQAFIESFNRISEKKRVGVLIDTTDVLEGTEVWDFLLEIGIHCKNSLFFLAGRNAKEVGEFLQSTFDKHVETMIKPIRLSPLKEQFSKAYLQQKQEMLHVTLEPEIAQRLVILASGRPILLDLAVEWQTREIPFDWLIKMDIKQLQSLSKKRNQLRQPDEFSEFENQLVSHITATRRLIDWLILTMSHVYPLNVEMIAVLLQISKNEAQILFDEAQSSVFIKQLPGRRISLHDEMRRMIIKYVWPEVDPDLDRRCQTSKLALEYLEKEIHALKSYINQLEAGEAELDVFMAAESAEQELWGLKRQRLVHTLFTNIEDGVTMFARMFDEATRAYRFSYRSTLLDEMKPYLDQLEPYLSQLSIEQQYELNSRKVKDSLASGTREGHVETVRLATKMLDQKEELFPEQQIDLYIYRGNANIRLGQLGEGISDFETAVQISRGHHLQYCLVRALNGRGWAYRNQENFTQAYTDYEEAYTLSSQLKDHKRKASILNNMSYIDAINGHKSKAIHNCQKALTFWKDIDFKRRIASTYSNLGFIHRLFDELPKAREYYDEALEIFTREDDREWMSNVRCGRAYVLLKQGLLDEAEKDLKWALANGVDNLKPRVLYYQGRLFLMKNDKKKARQKYQKCLGVSRKIGSRQFTYSSFDRLVELAWEFDEYDRWRTFHEEHKDIFAGVTEEINLGVSGSALRHIGDLAICQGDYNAALDIYKEGLLLLSEYKTYKPSGHTIHEQLEQTDARLRGCDTARVLLPRLGQELRRFWENKKALVDNYPAIKPIFERWEQEGDDS